MKDTEQQAEYIKKLVSINKLIHEDISSNDSFDLEDLERINERMSQLMSQLNFWTEQDNQDRFCYELKDYINWLLKEYS